MAAHLPLLFFPPCFLCRLHLSNLRCITISLYTNSHIYISSLDLSVKIQIRTTICHLSSQCRYFRGIRNLTFPKGRHWPSSPPAPPFYGSHLTSLKPWPCHPPSPHPMNSRFVPGISPHAAILRALDHVLVILLVQARCPSLPRSQRPQPSAHELSLGPPWHSASCLSWGHSCPKLIFTLFKY